MPYIRHDLMQCLCPGCRSTAAPWDIYCLSCREEMDEQNEWSRQQADDGPCIRRAVRMVMAMAALALLCLFAYDAVTR